MGTVTVEDRDTAIPRTAPTDSGVGFMAEAALKGDHTRAQEIRSMTQFERVYGTEASYSYLHRAARQFFDRGGSKLIVGRVVGPAAVLATANVTATGTTLVVNASSVGIWANGATGGISYDIVNGAVGGGATRQFVIKLNGVEVERSAEFDATRQAVVDWSQNSDYVRIALGGGSGLPATSTATNLAGGTDDNANITQAQRDAALALFLPKYGPGQVNQPGITTQAAHTSTIAHCELTDRAPVLDAPDVTATGKATLKTARDALKALTGAKRGAIFAPWIDIPGNAPGTTKAVPPGCIVMGRIARADTLVGPGQPAAGDYGLVDRAVRLRADFNDADAEELEESSVNLIREVNGDFLILGWRNLLDKTQNPSSWMWSNDRLLMFIRSTFRSIGGKYRGRMIDGRLQAINDFGTELTGFLRRLAVSGQLVPDPDDQRVDTAFRLDVGPTDEINSRTDQEAGRLEAEAAVRMAGFAEDVVIGLARVRLTQAL